MRIISIPSLNKGATIFEFATSDAGRTMNLEKADIVGIVAAYIAKGYYSCEIEERLSLHLNQALAAEAKQVYEMFEDWDGRGLWSQGPAVEDIRFTDDKLIRMYPNVGMDMERPADVDALFNRELTESSAVSSARNNTQTTDCLPV